MREEIDKLVLEARDDPEAFGRLYDIYYPRILGHIAMRVGNVDDTEDLTEQVFEKLLLGIKRYDPDRGSFDTWIYQITNNTLVDFYRRRGRQRRLELEEAQKLLQYDEPEGAVDNTRRYLKLMDLMRELPPSYQEILSLRFIDGKSIEEIAEILGYSREYTPVKVFRALKALRKLASKRGLLEELQRGVQLG